MTEIDISRYNYLAVININNMRKSDAKELTDKPFGVNIMLLSPFADEIAKLVSEEKIMGYLFHSILYRCFKVIQF